MITEKPGLCSCLAVLIDRMFSWLWEVVTLCAEESLGNFSIVKLSV